MGDCVKVSCLSPLKLLRTLAWKVAGSFLLVVLASCGGGSSNDSGGATATQLQGLYRANPLTKEFMSFVIPTSSGNATWYGWHFFHEDGNGTELARQEIPYTDLPLAHIDLYACWDSEHWVIMLPSEY